MTEFQKLFFGGAGIMTISCLLLYFAGCTSFDFSKMKLGLSPIYTEEPAKEKDLKEKSTEEAFDPNLRERSHTQGRARAYVDEAIHDYYNGSYEEALRRLERAKQFDPGNYEALRLSGQIQFEQNSYRKAFNDWSRATQLPNDDREMTRDMDVLKRVIRYCRVEIDRLQRTVNTHPNDRIATEKLKELQSRMQD